MINVSAEDLAAIVSRIDDALVLHDTWREALHRVLICRLPAPVADLGPHAHEQCGFGRWLYGKSNTDLLALPAFHKIEALHKTVHDKVRVIYEQRAAGHLVSVEDFDAYGHAAAAFRAEMLDLKARAAFTLENVDPLTGAFRQRQLLAELEAAQQRLRQTREPYGVLLLDLDLREINRAQGQGVGDQVLKTAIRHIRETLKAHDRIYRLVGAQFAVCMPGCDASTAIPHEAQIRGAIKAALEESIDVQHLTLELNCVAVELSAEGDPETQLNDALCLLNASGSEL